MRALDLFSGIGGIALAAEWAGIETAAFCEIEPYCRQVLFRHWPGVPIYEDVRELTRERLERDGVIGDGAIDLICGGYPCQPFSVAGKRRGTADDRHLWPEMLRLVRELRPNWVLGENVAGHVTLGLDTVLSNLESEGYTCRAFLIPACAVGAPHRRERVFIVAYADSTRREECHTSRESNRERHHTRSLVEDTCQGLADAEGFHTQRCHNRQRKGEPWGKGRGPTQSGLGRGTDGLSDWLDGTRWPAAYGEDQHDWEPPRVASGVKNQVPRLKALGNAVVPQQVYPILRAIKEAHERRVEK